MFLTFSNLLLCVSMLTFARRSKAKTWMRLMGRFCRYVTGMLKGVTTPCNVPLITKYLPCKNLVKYSILLVVTNSDMVSKYWIILDD